MELDLLPAIATHTHISSLQLSNGIQGDIYSMLERHIHEDRYTRIITSLSNIRNVFLDQFINSSNPSPLTIKRWLYLFPQLEHVTLSFCLLDARSGLSAKERHGVMTEFATQFATDWCGSAECPIHGTSLFLLFPSHIEFCCFLWMTLGFKVFIYFLSVIKSVLNDLFQHPRKHADKHSRSLQMLQPKQCHYWQSTVNANPKWNHHRLPPALFEGIKLRVPFSHAKFRLFLFFLSFFSFKFFLYLQQILLRPEINLRTGW